MRTVFTTAATLFAIATTAHAGNPDMPEVQPLAVAAPSITDWSGAYLGVSAGLEFGEYDRYGNTLDYLDTYQIDGGMYGGFAGYNFQSGAFVYGAELAYSLGDAHQSTSIYLNDSLDNVIDIKARAGFAFGNMLAYGVVGGSFGNWSNADTNNVYAFSGMVYGGGIDVQFGNGFFGGVEYLARNVSGESDLNAPAYDDFRFQTVQIRLGKRF